MEQFACFVQVFLIDEQVEFGSLSPMVIQTSFRSKMRRQTDFVLLLLLSLEAHQLTEIVSIQLVESHGNISLVSGKR